MYKYVGQGYNHGHVGQLLVVTSQNQLSHHFPIQTKSKTPWHFKKGYIPFFFVLQITQKTIHKFQNCPTGPLNR